MNIHTLRMNITALFEDMLVILIDRGYSLDNARCYAFTMIDKYIEAMIRLGEMDIEVKDDDE